MTKPEAKADLEQQLKELEAARDSAIADLQRVAADFDNYRKRTARDHQALVARATERLVKDLLPVLDDLERALEVAKPPEAPVRDSGQGEGVRGNRVEVPPTNDVALAKLEEGVRLVHRELSHVLQKEGLVAVETDGKFDPHEHEALLTQPSEAEEGAIVEVIQKGYRLGDRVLRPARVVVSAGGDQND
ncbi:MAG: nucleotide exchange factor GrpE [Gaiellaceae bacterium]